MLLGFLIRNEDEWQSWRAWAAEPLGQGHKPIVHVHEREPGFGGGGARERPGAVDEVVSCAESDDETVVG